MRISDLPIDSRVWAAREVARLPQQWAGRLLRSWDAREQAQGERTANLALVDFLAKLHAWSLPYGATDADICDAAAQCARRAQSILAIDRQFGPPYGRLVRYCQAQRVDPPPVKEGAPVTFAVRRMTCPLWWRRKLRAAHARAVEHSAIKLGYVSLRAERYCSDETVKRRAQQNRRNQATLENTIAENEEGQQFKLAELAARSTANKEIRRGELITRLKGFESIADECGHVAVFITLTAPSRYHARIRDGSENPKHDGSTPRDAAQYLAKVWARVRAKLDRDGVQVYGFRIAEPHGDGTPHQHFILFARNNAELMVLWAALREHALADSPDEAGATKYRVKFERIDKAKGSAVGYVIKYISKNIDGFRVGDWKIDGDLLGDATLNLSPRIDAWAATWRIRQFQQIGGPPVGLWREMRRVPREAAAAASDTLRDAWLAAQRLFDRRVVSADGEVLTVKLADFGDFTRAAGGPLMRRKDRPLSLEKETIDEGPDGPKGRYGEPLAPKPIGVNHRGLRWKTLLGICALAGPVPEGVRGMVRSLRRAWRIVFSKSPRSGDAVPRTRVNNCTEAGSPAPPETAGRSSPHLQRAGPRPPFPTVLAATQRRWLH